MTDLPPTAYIKTTIAVDNFIALVDNDLGDVKKSGEIGCWVPSKILEDALSEDDIKSLQMKKPSKKRKGPAKQPSESSVSLIIFISMTNP